jgi:hypothetical protein
MEKNKKPISDLPPGNYPVQIRGVRIIKTKNNDHRIEMSIAPDDNNYYGAITFYTNSIQLILEKE